MKSVLGREPVQVCRCTCGDRVPRPPSYGNLRCGGMLRARKHAHQARMGGGFKGGGGLKSNERSGSSCGEGQEGERGLDRYNTGGGKKQGFYLPQAKATNSRSQSILRSSTGKADRRSRASGTQGGTTRRKPGWIWDWTYYSVSPPHHVASPQGCRKGSGPTGSAPADLQTLSPRTSYCKTKPP